MVRNDVNINYVLFLYRILLLKLKKQYSQKKNTKQKIKTKKNMGVVDVVGCAKEVDRVSLACVSFEFLANFFYRKVKLLLYLHTMEKFEFDKGWGNE